jgi:hypothetical protein
MTPFDMTLRFLLLRAVAVAAVAAVAPPAAGTWEKFLLSDAVGGGAVCLDGSPGGGKYLFASLFFFVSMICSACRNGVQVLLQLGRSARVRPSLVALGQTLSAMRAESCRVHSQGGSEEVDHLPPRRRVSCPSLSRYVGQAARWVGWAGGRAHPEVRATTRIKRSLICMPSFSTTLETN